MADRMTLSGIREYAKLMEAIALILTRKIIIMMWENITSMSMEPIKMAKWLVCGPQVPMYRK